MDLNGREVTIFIDGQQLAGLFDGEISGTETELLVSTEGAVAKGLKPKKIKAPISGMLDAPCNTIWNMAANETNGFYIGPPRNGKFLGVLMTLTPNEDIKVSSVDLNQDDILSRKANSGVTSGANATVEDGMLLEGGSAEPQRFFFFLDRRERKPIELAATDRVNFLLTNKKNAAASIPVQLCTTLPKDVRIEN